MVPYLAKDVIELGFPGGTVIKNLPTMQETRVQSLGREDPLEEEMVTHSSILAWEILWTEEPKRRESLRWATVHGVTNLQVLKVGGGPTFRGTLRWTPNPGTCLLTGETQESLRQTHRR